RATRFIAWTLDSVARVRIPYRTVLDVETGVELERYFPRRHAELHRGFIAGCRARLCGFQNAQAEHRCDDGTRGGCRVYHASGVPDSLGFTWNRARLPQRQWAFLLFQPVSMAVFHSSGHRVRLWSAGSAIA